MFITLKMLGSGSEQRIACYQQFSHYRRYKIHWPMESEIRTIVTFESSAFNMTTPKDYFINPCCFGDDVAEWLIGELRKQGMGTDEKPGQEDFGWYLNFESAGIGHTFVIGHRPNGEMEEGTWIGWLERKRGLIGSILVGRKRGIQASAAELGNPKTRTPSPGAGGLRLSRAKAGFAWPGPSPYQSGSAKRRKAISERTEP
jgi:hypothetical protein